MKRTSMKQMLFGTSPIRMKQTLSRVATALLFTSCLALLPKAQAVNPKPDGGYPGGNTAEGQAALFSLTTGTYNTAVGALSLRSITTGNFNTATGAGTLLANTGDQNTATGAVALLSNTTGYQNTANGVSALFHNTGGFANTANGTYALYSNTTGYENTATGGAALQSNTTASGNTATGASALKENTTGYGNTATGFQGLVFNTTGSVNTADGAGALHNNSTGNNNTATGSNALLGNTIGGRNTATGSNALYSNTIGANNTATGFNALYNNTTGSNNTAVGFQALSENTNDDNTAVGQEALQHSTGQRNVAVGMWAGIGVTTASDVICIGTPGEDVGESCYIGEIWNRTVSGGAAVFINNAGRLGTTTSSRRFKEDIKPMNNASEALFALKPVTFRYKKEIDLQGIPQFGLVAEEVEKVNPDLVIRDKDGKVNTVRYEQINAMLLNEFLKEHKAFVEEQEKVKKLEAGVAGLLATVKEQAAQIEKVSAHVQMRQPRMSVARINP
jgi:trimeric autotransporter adhesin